ncbi:hypothetical protein FHX15_004916 [Rhizobium sp. BK650]|nr:hypothetical protein [Rhizobium sp. BK650]
MSSLPVVGAAMTIDELENHRNWLFEKSRDLELQSFIDADVLNGDWTPRADRARKLLDGFKGRVGIHGPFWGFVIASQDPDIRAVVSRRMLQGLDVAPRSAARTWSSTAPIRPGAITTSTTIPASAKASSIIAIRRCGKP